MVKKNYQGNKQFISVGAFKKSFFYIINTTTWRKNWDFHIKTNLILEAICALKKSENPEYLNICEYICLFMSRQQITAIFINPYISFKIKTVYSI